MIPISYIEEWRSQAPWQTLDMVEQDLIISRALVDLYNTPQIASNLAFRGGTALNKLFINPSSRYSEDIDLVQLQASPIGDTQKAIRKALDPWLGMPQSRLTKRSLKLTYRYPTSSNITGKLKIEINTTEHFHLLPLINESYNISNPWFSRKTTITTYELAELMATKLCALYQRSKGRDLFDLWLVHNRINISSEKIVRLFEEYCQKVGAYISRANFEENIVKKSQQKSFREDINPLLTPDTPWDFGRALALINNKYLPHLKGEPWKLKPDEF